MLNTDKHLLCVERVAAGARSTSGVNYGTDALQDTPIRIEGNIGGPRGRQLILSLVEAGEDGSELHQGHWCYVLHAFSSAWVVESVTCEYAHRSKRDRQNLAQDYS